MYNCIIYRRIPVGGYVQREEKGSAPLYILYYNYRPLELFFDHSFLLNEIILLITKIWMVKTETQSAA